MEVEIPPRVKGQLWRQKGAARCEVQGRSAVSWAVQKRLNRSRCRLGRGLCGLVWAQWSYVLGVHIGATWRIRLNRPYATAMRTFWSTYHVTYHVRPYQPIIDQQGLGLRGLVHKEAHPVIPDLH